MLVTMRPRGEMLARLNQRLGGVAGRRDEPGERHKNRRNE